MPKGRKMPSERQPERQPERRPEQGDEYEIVEERPSIAVAAGFGKLSGLLGEQAVKCLLRRRDEDTKKWEYQDTFPVEDFSYEFVRDVFGGGEYQIQAMDEGGEFVKSFTFHIDHRYKGKRWIEEHGRVSVAGTGTGDGSQTWLAATLDKMGDAIKLLAERKPEPPPAPPPAPDPMAMIRAIGETMKSLTPAAPPLPPPAPDLEKQLSLIEKVVNVGTKIIDARGDEGGGGGSGDAYMGVVSKLAEPVIELVKTQAQRERLRSGRHPALPPAAGPVPEQAAATSPSPAEGAPSMPWLLEVQRWLPLIAKRQQKGLSAEDTAFFVMDELSEPTLAALAELAAQDTFGEQVKKILPADLLRDPAWIDEFLAAVRDYLFEDATEQPEGISDLDEEARKRLALLRDRPEEPEQQQEPAP